MGELVFDAQAAERLDGLYRGRDILRRRQIVTEALRPQLGQWILDVGCGPGFYLAELSEQVGQDGLAAGVDNSPDMLAIAAQRCARGNVVLHQADAISLPVEDGVFGAALAVQVLEYVPDVAAAAGELHRVVRPGGRVVIWDVDWSTLSWHSRDPARMRRVLGIWDRHVAHPALPRTLAPLLRLAGFEDVQARGYAFVSTDLTADSYAGTVFPFIEQFAAAAGELSRDEVTAWAAEQRELSRDGQFFLACTQFCFAATRAPAPEETMLRLARRTASGDDYPSDDLDTLPQPISGDPPGIRGTFGIHGE